MVDGLGLPLTKGTTLVDLVKRARSRVEDVRRVLPPETRGVLETRVLAASWYPETYLRDLLVAVDRVEGKGDLALCRVLGRQSAGKDLLGVYRSMLVPGDPLATLQAMRTLWTLYHDTGETTVVSARQGEAVATVRGHGLPSRALCLVQEGWIAEAVVLAGGSQGEVTNISCRNLGNDFCAYRVNWL